MFFYSNFQHFFHIFQNIYYIVFLCFWLLFSEDYIFSDIQFFRYSFSSITLLFLQYICMGIKNPLGDGVDQQHGSGSSSQLRPFQYFLSHSTVLVCVLQRVGHVEREEAGGIDRSHAAGLFWSQVRQLDISPSTVRCIGRFSGR